MRKFHIVAAIMGFLLTSCASQPKRDGPDWVRQATRTVDNGYIVYVGTGESRDTEKAQFKAEGMALEDLANECSFIPKGARLEDRYVEKGENKNIAYVKVAVEFQECSEAQKTLEPTDIKKLANTSFTGQLRRYQDLEETGEFPGKSEYAELDTPQQVPAPPARQVAWDDSVHFSVMRQYVAYQKEIVILSPANVYPPHSPQSINFVSALQPTAGQIQQTALQNPGLVKNPQPWSKIYDRPHFPRPTGLVSKRKSEYRNALPYMKQNNLMKNQAKKSRSGKGRKPRGYGSPEREEHQK